MTPELILGAATRAIYKAPMQDLVGGNTHGDSEICAKAALDVATPIIEAELRERIARELEHNKHRLTLTGDTPSPYQEDLRRSFDAGVAAAAWTTREVPL